MGYSTILKTTCFRLTLRNVNGQGKTYHLTKKACFRLTIRNVNEPVPEPPVVVPDSFRLTIRNVNMFVTACLTHLMKVLD